MLYWGDITHALIHAVLQLVSPLDHDASSAVLERAIDIASTSTKHFKLENT